MEMILNKLFDFQRIAGNTVLAELIADTERRYSAPVPISDDGAAFISAAAGSRNPRQESAENPIEVSLTGGNEGGL